MKKYKHIWRLKSEQGHLTVAEILSYGDFLENLNVATKNLIFFSGSMGDVHTQITMVSSILAFVCDSVCVGDTKPVDILT